MKNDSHTRQIIVLGEIQAMANRGMKERKGKESLTLWMRVVQIQPLLLILEAFHHHRRGDEFHVRAQCNHNFGKKRSTKISGRQNLGVLV